MKPLPFLPFRRFGLQRIAAVAVLLLQTAIGLAPLGEAPAQRQLRAHIEEPGARHVGLHNEATCLVCAVRAMHATASTPGELELRSARTSGVEPTRGARVTDARSLPTNRSRAPPTLS